MTVWMPPDHPPQFDVILEPDDKRKRKILKDNAGTDNAATDFDESLEPRHGLEQERVTHDAGSKSDPNPSPNNIPRQATAAPGPSAVSQPSERPTEQLQQGSQLSNNLGDYSISAEEPLPLDPNLSSAQDDAFLSSLNQNPGSLGAQSYSQLPDSQPEESGSAQAKKPRKPRSRKSANPNQDPQMQLDVVSLQNQIQQQNEMIMRLQQQLAAQSQSQSQSSASQAQMPAQLQFSDQTLVQQGQSFTDFADAERLANSQAQRMQNQQALQALHAQYQRQQMEQYGNPL